MRNMSRVSIPQAVSTIAMTECVFVEVTAASTVSIPQAVSTIAIFDLSKDCIAIVPKFQYRKR